jgi:hypothetical protein
MRVRLKDFIIGAPEGRFCYWDCVLLDDSIRKFVLIAEITQNARKAYEIFEIKDNKLIEHNRINVGFYWSEAGGKTELCLDYE